jgi:hypothetical protein
VHSNGKVFIAVPVKHWWDENWKTPPHRAFMAWRDLVYDKLVEADFLCYAPWRAWRGPWDEVAQAGNDVALRICDVMVNLRPPGVPSDGTDGEAQQIAKLGKPVVDGPPPKWGEYPEHVIFGPHDYEVAADALVEKLLALDLGGETTDQLPHADTIPLLNGETVRVHFRGAGGSQEIATVHGAEKVEMLLPGRALSTAEVAVHGDTPPDLVEVGRDRLGDSVLMDVDEMPREAAFATVLKPFVSHVRWLSIGSVKNVAEVRVRREDYERAVRVLNRAPGEKPSFDWSDLMELSDDDLNYVIAMLSPEKRATLRNLLTGKVPS